MKQRLANLTLYLIGAFILSIFALYNGYPIVTGDTTTYINSGMELWVPAERPIFYGLFIRATSLGASLWPTIFAQSFILSCLLVHFIKGIAPQIRPLHVIGLLLLVSLGTIISWYSSQLMADIFTPVLFLATVNYLLFSKSRLQSAVFLVIIYFATIAHFSNCIISTLFTGALLLASSLRSQLKDFRFKAVRLILVSLLAWLTIFTSNYIGGKGFVSSSVSHIFLMGKLSESGVLKTYLDKACPTRDYKICAYKDSLPPAAWEFVWNESKSPLYLTGGWEANRQEYKTIIKDIGSRPKYWPFLAWKSVEATAREMVLTNIDESEERPWFRYEREHPLYQSILKHFPHEINEFSIDRQNMKTLNIVFYDDLYVVVLILTSLICLFFLRGALLAEAKLIYVLAMLFLIINAFASATFANVLSRLSSRAIWLIPMINLLFIYRMAALYFKRLKIV